MRRASRHRPKQAAAAAAGADGAGAAAEVEAAGTKAPGRALKAAAQTRIEEKELDAQ